MPTTLQFRRGNTTQNNAFTGAAGELTVDSTTNTLRLHDGSTAGGEGVVGLTATQTLTNKTLTSPTINGGTFSGTFTGTISPGQVTTNSIVSNGSNADISIQPSGTGDVLLSALRVNGTTLDSSDSTKITIAENVDITGTLAVAGALSSATSLALASGATVTGIADEDNMASDSATLIATQQSIKAYVDAQDAAIASDTLTLTNKTFDVEGTGNSISNIDVADFKAAAIVTESEGIGSNDNDTTLPTSAAVKDYVDTQITAEDLDFQADSGGALSIDLDSETMTFTGGTGIDTSGSGNTVTFAIDSTVATLTGSQTLTNKVLTAPTISAPTITGTATIGAVTTNTISSNGSNADLSIQPSGTGDVLISALRVNGTTLDSADSTKITLAENVDVTGTLSVAGALSSSTSLALASGATVTGIADEDNMASDSNTLLATQQSIKAYVDAQITAEDLDFQADSGGALAIDLDSETLTFTGGTGIDTSGSGNAVTFAIDSTVATLTGSQTLTNKVLTSPTINSPTIATPTVTGAMTATSVTTNDVTTNGSNADLDVSPQGTGKVQFYGAYTFPTSDGSNGTALVTDGSGTLSFGSVGSKPVSDDGAALSIADKRITSTARTIDSFHSTFQDSVLYYVVSNDHNEDCINVQKVSVCHNDSGAFISSAGAQSKASTTMTAFTAGLTNDMVRVKAASSNAVGGTLSFYKFGLGDNTSTGTSGNVIISQNTDVDSASETLVSFAHADFRGAKLFISINNASKTEVGNTEALVVHDGSDAFINQFGGIQTGNNPLLTLTATIDGDNVVVSAAGGETNLRVTVHAIMLKDTMTSNDGTYANAEAIAPVTVSSSATEVDTLVETTNNGAVYYLVSKNASEGEYAVNEVFLAMGSGEITVASGPFVSTKGTNQLAFTSDYKDDVENTGQLLVSSTSGGSTTVSAYRINLLAK